MSPRPLALSHPPEFPPDCPYAIGEVLRPGRPDQKLYIHSYWKRGAYHAQGAAFDLGLSTFKIVDGDIYYVTWINDYEGHRNLTSEELM